MADESDILKTEAELLSRGRGETLPDQWMTQIIIRIMKRAKIVYVSEMPDSVVEEMHMIPAHTLDEALNIAKKLVKTGTPTVTAIPDGVSVIVKMICQTKCNTF